jgi:hypothetical protein
VAKISSDGSRLLSSTFLGGAGRNAITGLRLDGQQIVVVGETNSPFFPTTPDGSGPISDGNIHGFSSVLDGAVTTLLFSTTISGSGNDQPSGVALDSAKNIFVVGRTTSVNFPTSPGAAQITYGGGARDGFLVELPAKVFPPPPSCLMPKRPVPKIIALDFGVTVPWADKPHNGVDYHSDLGNMIQSVGPGGIIHPFTEPNARQFGSIDPDHRGPAIWVRYTLATGDPIYVLYGHTATSWQDQSSGSGSTFHFDANYSIQWKTGDLINSQTVIGLTAPFYNGGRSQPHLHISVFKPNKSCSQGTEFCGIPPNGWGYSDLTQQFGDYINPEIFFTDAQYCLKP